MTMKAGKTNTQDLEQVKKTSSNQALAIKQYTHNSSNGETLSFKANDFSSNTRGWLESSNVQVNPAHASNKPTMSKSNILLSSEMSQKDVLGTVSDEDILKLTEMTVRLPELTNPASKSTSKSKTKRHQRHNLHSLQTKKPKDTKNVDNMITSNHAASNICKSNDQTNPIEHDKRRSRLPVAVNEIEENNKKSEAALIADEFYQKNPRTDHSELFLFNHHSSSSTGLLRIHSVNITPSSDILLKKKNISLVGQRRHSFGSVQQPLIEGEELKSTWKPQTDMNELKEERQEPNYLSEEEEEVFMFDFFSLPSELKNLVDIYDKKGKMERKRMKVNFKEQTNYDNEEGVIPPIETVDYQDFIGGDEEIDFESNPIRDIAIIRTTRSDNVEFTKLIQLTSNDLLDNGPLLDLRVSLFGNITKSSQNNKIDTHVINEDTIITEANEFDIDEQEEFNEVLRNVENRLDHLEIFKKDSTQFLQDHINSLESLKLFDRLHLKNTTTNENDSLLRPTLPRISSHPSFGLNSIIHPIVPEYHDDSDSLLSSSSSISSHQSSSSSGIILRPNENTLRHKESSNRYSSDHHRHSMYINPTDIIIKTCDPFDDRLDEIRQVIRSLEGDLDEFKVSLKNTEDLVNDVQLEMDDFKNRMEFYIKDIPESHYSALKKLEVDIESILSKRAKNPWLETGYALLSYLLTCFALLIWIIIYVLKRVKRVILFPKKLWKTYSDYLVERNKAVKEASLRSVMGSDMQRHDFKEEEISMTATTPIPTSSSLLKRSAAAVVADKP
ncbi:uncharacterized protein BX663DRAFT_518705 [Cokeromyces recurvatus]|uniref:uncharacterized protein n=1 Tax=Cokeromyces recurvatus TaxID=90255 RepID=UPI00221F4834|nr:uncharacterized protein BX663DRAFT_522467 [Cokeromyces recurvatus]XP_051380121.1 uncharacterized protein BX663DRAFT_518705 [Cokeromyces recurvatus]KAI7899150.1 hypothetical protein BX663DRAFT_522467 [Cokeromyces recurvatus]KAI7900136.1 hypothetical protein BX663DRAFT_518705 [Cokeromyces recurvatus]